MMLVVALLSIPVPAEDWACFRGPTRQGISHEVNLPVTWSASENVHWRTGIPGQGWSSPIVYGERVFVTTAVADGSSYCLLCLDRDKGTILWNRQVVRQAAGHRNRLNSYATSTPATDGAKIYVLASDGTVAAVSMEGEIVWRHHEIDYYSEHGLGVSLVLYQDLVIWPFDGSSPGPDKHAGWQTPWDQAVILAVDKNTGRTRWRGRRGSSRIAHVTPQIVEVNGRDQLVSGAGDVVQGFDLETGRRIWTVSAPGEGVVPSIVAGDGMIYATSGFGESAIRAIRTDGTGDVTDTHIVWSTDRDVPKVPSMLYVRPYLYVLTEAGLLKCINGRTGDVVWRERLAGKYSASPVYADGHIYFLNEAGKSVVIEAGPEFKKIAENELEDKCLASPAISEGKIFIRTASNLYCIGEP
jgi:outer membrane protein assembly factor BamB